MAKFSYKILNKNNKIEEGEISAFFKRSAKKKLNKPGSTVISISLKKSLLFKNLSFVLSGFSRTERINFYRNFSTMGSAGLSIVETLETLSEQVKSNRVKKAILAIAQDAKNGQRLSESMAKFPKYFPSYMVETINMGDVSGKLNETIDRIATDLEKDDELARKVKSALAYPLVVVVVMVAVVLGLMFYILPGIEKLYQSFEIAVPQPTRSLLFASGFMATNKLYVLISSGLILILIILLSKIKKCHYFIHSLILRIPVFGPLIKEYNLILFFRSLESLFTSGISLIQAVEIAKKTTKNDVYKKALESINPILLRGVPLSDTLSPFPSLFPVQTQKIIRVGEQTGKLTETIKRITRYFERSVDYKTRTMASLIEPILMIILAVLVGTIAVSVFLPLYKLVNLF
jgi:type IV pilus assembly protein PilC